MSTGESYKNGHREGFKDGYIQGKFDGELKKTIREIKEKDLLNLYRKYRQMEIERAQGILGAKEPYYETLKQIEKLEKELEHHD